MYHRVSFVQNDPWGLAVDPERFEEQIAYAKQHRSPMSVDEFVERLRTNTLPADAIAVTFDDGYRDNLINAKPVLTRYGIPATLFLATGFVDQDTPFWWDELATMILASTQAVHEQHVLADEVINLDWDQPESSDTTGEWRAWNEPRTPRQRTYLAIWRRLRLATAQQRDLAMNRLRQSFRTAIDSLGGPLSSNEIRTQFCDGLIQLGAHTVTHPSLTSLDRLECRREILDSRNRCRELAAKSVNGFAYPYGDMSLEVQHDVASLGFSWACSTQGSFAERPNIYALPRIAAPNAPMRTLIGLMTSPR